MYVRISKEKTTMNEHIVNLCDSKPRPDILKFIMAGLAIPNYCPVKENSTFCMSPQTKLRLSDSTQRMLSFLALTSRVNIRVKIEHDTGKSCFEGVHSFVKY